MKKDSWYWWFGMFAFIIFAMLIIFAIVEATYI